MCILLEVIYTIIDIVFLQYFLSYFIKQKSCKDGIMNYIRILIFGVIVYKTTDLSEFTTLSNMLALIEMIIFSFISFQGSIHIKLIYTIIYNSLLGGVTSFILTSISIVMAKEVRELVALGTISRFWVVIIVKISVLITLIFIKHFTSYFTMDIPRKYRYMVLGVLAISFITIGAIFEVTFNANNSNSISKFMMPIIISLISYNFLVLVVIEKISSFLKEEEINSIILNNQVNLEQHILELEKTYQETKKAKHDMQNHYEVLEYLLAQKKYKECQVYLTELKSSIKQTPIYYKTGNNIVDAVINQKIELNKEYGIDFQINVHIPSNIHIEAMDWGAMLSNLLDNAIEEVRDIREQKNRMIKLETSTFNQQLLINISNTVIRNPIREGKLVRRVKTHFKEHGYGMKSIQYVVDKYCGYMTYKCENNVFQVSILFRIDS